MDTKTVRVRLLGPPGGRNPSAAKAAAAIVAADRRNRAAGRRAAILAILFGGLQVAICSWFLMLAVGVFRHHWLPGLPTIDFATAVWVVSLIQVLRYADPR